MGQTTFTVRCVMHICHGWYHCLCWSDWLRVKLLVGVQQLHDDTEWPSVINNSNITTGQ